MILRAASKLYMMRLALLLLVVAWPACAETYKWVDDKGVVNYSNNPPPSAGKAKQVRAVADRISTYQTDPAYEQYLRQRAEQIAAAQEAEWAERQRYLAAAQAFYPPDYNSSSYYADYYRGYAYPMFVVGTVRRHHVTHHGGGRNHVAHRGGGHGFSSGRGR